MLVQTKVLVQYTVPEVAISWLPGKRTGQAHDIYPHTLPASNYLQLWRFLELGNLQWSFIPNTCPASPCTHVKFLASKISFGKESEDSVAFCVKSYLLWFVCIELLSTSFVSWPQLHTTVMHNTIINFYIYIYIFAIVLCFFKKPESSEIPGGRGDWSSVVGNWACLWGQNVWAHWIWQKGRCKYGAGSLRVVRAADRKVLKNVLGTRSC